MKKLGVFIGENNKGIFFRDILNELNKIYAIEAFESKQFNIPLLAGRLNRWSFQNNIAQLLKRSDLAFFEWASELLAIASHMPKACPIVARLHSFELYVWAHKINWDNVDHIIFISHSIRAKFLERFPVPKEKTSVIYNGVNLQRFSVMDTRLSSNRIGMVANFHPVKRIYEAVLLVHKLNQRDIDVTLHLAGAKWPDGWFDDYYTSIERLIEKLKLQNQVKIYGHVEDVPTWLSNVDIFLSNSYWEGQQVGLLEALAAGCVCFSHFWDGSDEVLPESNIFVTDDELIQKIDAFLKLDNDQRVSAHLAMNRIAQDKFSQKQQIELISNTIAATLN